MSAARAIYQADISHRSTTHSGAHVETRLKAFTERRGECHRRLQQAYGTMNDTTERLGMMSRPGVEAVDSSTGQDFEVLDRLIERLKEENLIAQRVHEQLTDNALRTVVQ